MSDCVVDLRRVPHGTAAMIRRDLGDPERDRVGGDVLDRETGFVGVEIEETDRNPWALPKRAVTVPAEERQC